MPDVITRVSASGDQEIRAKAPGRPADTFIYTFKTSLNPAREIAFDHSSRREVSMSVTVIGKKVIPVRATLIKPNGEVAKTVDLTKTALPQGPIFSATGANLSSADAAVVAALRRGPIDLDLSGGFEFEIDWDDVLNPPPVSLPDVFKYQIQADDPNGTWKIELTNIGRDDDVFRISVVHPEAQLRLNTSTVPVSFLQRMADKAVRLMSPRLELDEDKSVLRFSEEFGHFTGIEFFRGEPIRESGVAVRSLNTQAIGVHILDRDGSVEILTNVRFEVGGPTEIVINNVPDIDISRFDIAVRLKILAPNESSNFGVISQGPHFEQRDLRGNVINPTSGRMGFEFSPTVNISPRKIGIPIFKEVDLKETLEIEALKTARGNRDRLGSFSGHLTDSLMFLATGRGDQEFYDMSHDGENLVVRHYLRPGSPVSFPVFHPQPAPLPTVDGDRKIDHIVVLMMENRSFDHMMGYLKIKGGRADVDGLTGPAENNNPKPDFNPPALVPSHPLSDTLLTVDPDHSRPGVLEQIAGGEMSGFITSYLNRSGAGDADLVMGYYTDESLSVFDMLASEYTVCDRYFSAHPGPTYPNRFVALSGTTPAVDNLELGGDLAGAVKADTIFDVLNRGGLSWNYVESNIAFLRMFDRYRLDETNIIQRLPEFNRLARAGQLPAVTWIDPNFGEIEIDGGANDDHVPADVLNGQLLISEIYEALTHDEDQWNKTLFIITYDEHGGFYDHVPPHGLNGADEPKVQKIHPDGADFYGVRVPALVVSPWVSPGSVSSTVYDHTSILKTILANFFEPEVAEMGLLGKRVDAANSLLDVLGDTLRTGVPECPRPEAGRIPALENIERDGADSFHLSMRFFPFGPGVKRKMKETV